MGIVSPVCMSYSLLFIADISGFTKFVNETEINHSRHIVSELLEALIDSDKLNMEVAEIEGDAVLFYKYREVPGVDALLAQGKEMFLEFHSHLANYKQRRICHCGACSSAHNLTIKFIAHRADFNFVRVKTHRKPHGSDVILAHRLLKNDIPGQEYLLFSEGFSSSLTSSELSTKYPWVKIGSAASTYDDIGETTYQFISLEALKKQIEVKPSIFPVLTKDPIIVEGLINLDSATLFELIANFDFRDQWNNAPLSMEFEKDRVNRVGTRHVCVFSNEEIEFETVTNDFGSNKLVYGERLDNYKFVKEATNYFILEDKEGQTLLRIESHIMPKNKVIKLFSLFYKMIFRKTLKKAFGNIEGAARRLKLRGANMVPLKELDQVVNV